MGSFTLVSLLFSHYQFNDQHDAKLYFDSDQVPEYLREKITMIGQLRSNISKILSTSGDALKSEVKRRSSFPWVDVWFRIKVGMVFLLSDGTLQLNFSKVCNQVSKRIIGCLGSHKADSLLANGFRYVHRCGAKVSCLQFEAPVQEWLFAEAQQAAEIRDEVDRYGSAQTRARKRRRYLMLNFFV